VSSPELDRSVAPALAGSNPAPPAPAISIMNQDAWITTTVNGPTATVSVRAALTRQ
jgi:hypothetical protein